MAEALANPLDALQDPPPSPPLLPADERNPARGEPASPPHRVEFRLHDDPLGNDGRSVSQHGGPHGAFALQVAGDDDDDGVQGHAPTSLLQRRTNLLVVADPAEDGCFFMRMSADVRQEKRGQLLRRIQEDDPALVAAKFYNLQLGPEGAVQLRRALQTNTSLRKLFLTGNALGPLGTKALAKAVLTHSALTKLDLQCNRIGIDGAKCIAEVLANNNVLLDLNLAGNAIGDRGCEVICNALIFNRRSRLQRLDVGNNRLLNGGFHLSRILRQCQELRVLYAWHNQLGNRSRGTNQSGFRHIAETLPFNKSLVLTDFTFNNIQPGDAYLLLDTARTARETAQPDLYHVAEPQILKIIEGNLIPQALIPELATYYCLFRLPILDPYDPPSCEPTVPAEAAPVEATVVLDKGKLRQGPVEVAMDLRGEATITSAPPARTGSAAASSFMEPTNGAEAAAGGGRPPSVNPLDRIPSHRSVAQELLLRHGGAEPQPPVADIGPRSGGDSPVGDTDLV